MNVKIATIISSCVLLLLSVGLALIFIITFANTGANLEILRISANDLTICKGDVIEDYYTISNADAEIKIEVDKEGIIDIDEEKIEAISIGQVNVTLTMELDGKSCQDTFKVTVINNDYSVEIMSMSGCYYDKILYMTEERCIFQVKILDKNGQDYKTDIEMSVDDNAILQKGVGMYVLICSSDSILKIEAKEINYTYEISVQRC